MLSAIAALLSLVACSGGGRPVENIDFTWLASGQNDVVLDATQLVNGREVTSFHWAFGDGATATTTQDVTVHRYPAPGDYTVTLTGRDAAANEYVVTHVVSASL